MHSGSGPTGPVRHFTYRRTVDGLRGVAVLCVLGFHAFPEYVPGGYVGVDVFFVVSGFLITGIIDGQLSHGEFSFADFYIRRVRRLFPALVLVLIASLGLGWMVLFPDEFERIGGHVAAAGLFAANVAFWRESGYFAGAAEFRPLLHLWSLGIEEQFYLVWPVMLVSLWRHRTVLLTVLCLLVLGSFALSVRLAVDAPVANFYLPFSRFWELGLGCLLALAKHNDGLGAWFTHATHRLALQSALRNFVPLLGLAFIIAAVVSFNEDTAFPSWPALLPTVGTLLILATPEQGWFQRSVLGAPILVWTGLVSYALYLWHWPLLSFASVLQAGPLPTFVKWLALLLSFALAWLTYRFVEIPVRRHKQFKIHVGLIAGGALATIAGVSVHAAAGFAGRFDYDVQVLRPRPRVDAVCTTRFPADRQFNYCLVTSAEPPKIIFLGDSKAHAVYEGAAALLAAKYPIMLLGRGGCPPLLGVRIRGHAPHEEECDDVWKLFVRYVQHVKPRVVVLVANGSFLLTDPKIELDRQNAASFESKEAVVEYGIRNLVTALARSSTVIHVGEIPGFPTSPSCFLRPLRLPTTRCSPELDRNEVERAMASYNAVLDRVQRTLPELQRVDSVQALCEARRCSQQFAAGPILYSDDIHLTPLGGRLLVERTGLPRLIAQAIEAHDDRRL